MTLVTVPIVILAYIAVVVTGIWLLFKLLSGIGWALGRGFQGVGLILGSGEEDRKPRERFRVALREG